MDEFALIRHLTSTRSRHSAGAGTIVGIGDDAAVVAPTPGMQTVITCDTMVESVHFLPWTMDDESIGWKAMASNISDLAAMGALPRYALVAVSVPRGFPTQRLELIYAGLYACAERYGVSIIGGDTTSSPQHVVMTVTAIGEVEADQALLRSGAQPGDVVFVTGPLGVSAAGLHLLQRKEADVEPFAALVSAHRRPEPQIAAGRALIGEAHALNDVSDGLASEVWEIAEASGVAIELEASALPVADELKAYAKDVEKDPLEFILYGGEDYQLVGTMPPWRAGKLPDGASIVGVVRAGPANVTIRRPEGDSDVLLKKGYNHFVE